MAISSKQSERAVSRGGSNKTVPLHFIRLRLSVRDVFPLREFPIRKNTKETGKRGENERAREMRKNISHERPSFPQG